MFTDPESGEITEDRDKPSSVYAPCGRKWGTELWPGGPILGGVNWREFVAERERRKAGGR